MRPAEIGTCSDGLRIMQLTRAIAFGIVQFGTMLGKLKGVIDATMPTGYHSTRHSTPLLTSSTSPAVICGSEQANSVSSADFNTSARPSERILPFSSVTSAESSSMFFSSSALYRKKTCTRSLIGIPDQIGNAFFAASTARSTSLADDNGTREITLPSAGLVTSRCCSTLGSTNVPPM